MGQAMNYKMDLPSEKVTVSHGALSKGLSSRQITMISIGGVIGAGFFVGSASAISAAGPAVLVSFGIAAVLVVLVMGMLAELATASPDTGSFSTYAQQAMGRWAGFSIGWLYWWFYVLVIPLETIVASDILGGWLGVSSIAIGVALIVGLTLTNILSVKNFGTLEYWFSLIKVVAILAFIGLGVFAISGMLPSSSANGVGHLWRDGGFAPTGSLELHQPWYLHYSVSLVWKSLPSLQPSLKILEQTFERLFALLYGGC